MSDETKESLIVDEESAPQRESAQSEISTAFRKTCRALSGLTPSAQRRVMRAVMILLGEP